MALGKQGLSPAPHHELMIRELEGVAAGRSGRLMLLLPPGSAKSTYTSLLFPPWFLSRHPTAQVIAASAYGEPGLRVRAGGAGVDRGAPGAAGAGHGPDEPGGGAVRAAERRELLRDPGCGGPVTGRRADLLIIDDPVKSQREADSAAAREHLWEWFRSDLVTPGYGRGGACGAGDDALAPRMIWAAGCWRAATGGGCCGCRRWRRRVIRWGGRPGRRCGRPWERRSGAGAHVQRQSGRLRASIRMVIAGADRRLGVAPAVGRPRQASVSFRGACLRGGVEVCAGVAVLSQGIGFARHAHHRPASETVHAPS